MKLLDYLAITIFLQDPSFRKWIWPIFTVHLPEMVLNHTIYFLFLSKNICDNPKKLKRGNKS